MRIFSESIFTCQKTVCLASGQGRDHISTYTNCYGSFTDPSANQTDPVSVCYLIRGQSKKVFLDLSHVEKCGFLHGVQHVSNITFKYFWVLQNFDYFCCISWEMLEWKFFKFLETDQNRDRHNREKALKKKNFEIGSRHTFPERKFHAESKNHVFRALEARV